MTHGGWEEGPQERLGLSSCMPLIQVAEFKCMQGRLPGGGRLCSAP